MANFAKAFTAALTEFNFVEAETCLKFTLRAALMNCLKIFLIAEGTLDGS
jgi:hypothetical protein